MVERIICGTVNCYLLIGEGGSILVDAANASDASRIYDRVKYENVRLILLTHGHPDHVGAAFAVARLLHVPVALSKKDAPLLESPVVRKLRGHTFLGRVLAFASKRKQRREKPFPLPDVWLEDDQDLSGYGVSARVIALPGHTEGSMGVLADGGDFIVGDALFNIFRPTTALLYEDRERMEESVEKIINSGARLLYVGHGKPFPVTEFTRSGDGHS